MCNSSTCQRYNCLKKDNGLQTENMHDISISKQHDCISSFLRYVQVKLARTARRQRNRMLLVKKELDRRRVTGIICVLLRNYVNHKG